MLESPPPLVKKLRLSHIVLICAPLIPSLVPSLPMEWAEVGSYADQRVFLGVPISCGGKFWSAHHLSWDKAPSLTPKSLPSLPKHWAQVRPNGYWGVHFGVPLHLGASFSVPTSSDRLRLAPLTPSLLPSLQLALAHSPHSQLAPNGQWTV